MKKRRAVLEVNTDFSPRAADMNSSSVTSSMMSESFKLTRRNDGIMNITMADPFSNVSEMDRTRLVHRGDQSYTPWQTCTDDSSGYTYYWNMETNQVTWEMPSDYLTHEAALQPYQLTQNNSAANEIHPLDKHRIARTTREVVANRHSLSKKLSVEGKPMQAENNDRVGLVPYGPAWEDDGKMASARKRLLSYKSDKLKPKSDEAVNISMYADACVSSTTASYPPKHEVAPSKIPFVPTPDEIKEHPIFSNFTSSSSHVGASETQASKALVPQYTDSIKPSLVAEHYCSEGEGSEDDEDDEHSDDVIITRLRKKALMLKELGGDVPKEIISVLDSTKTARDIIAEIEREIPLDANDDDSLMEMDIDTDDETENVQSSASLTCEPVPAGLENVSGGAGSTESRTSSRSLPTTRKAGMKNVQKIKLSARARELIKTSLLTAKARATNFVETVDGLKPVDEVRGGGQNKEYDGATRSSANEHQQDAAGGRIESDRHESPDGRGKRIEAEITGPRSAKRAETCSTASLAPLTKLTPADRVPAGIEFEPQTNRRTATNATLPSTDAERRTCASTVVDDDALEQSSEKRTRADMFSFQSSFVVPNVKRVKVAASADDTDAAKVSLVSKCDEFLLSVKKSVDIETRKRPLQTGREEEKNSALVAGHDTSVDELLNSKEDEEKNVVDFSQLIVEKLKFLNDGKSSVTPVQVMAIQIETLIGAWQIKALSTKYLQEWLTISSEHLKGIEEAAAPAGWQCEWDRSYGRYYYRNKRTGTIQWDFPETDSSTRPDRTKRARSPQGRECANERPKTPPPPTISKMIVPPPPPVISDLDTRHQKSTQLADSVSARPSPPPTVAPPLPATPVKPATPPPPPPPSPPLFESVAAQSSSPAISEPSLFPSSDSASATSKLTPVRSAKKSSSGLHDELNSFYSDIASLEATFSQSTDKTNEEQPAAAAAAMLSSAERHSPRSEVMVTATKVGEKTAKKRKKVKLDAALSLKKKGLEGLVAKWQKVNTDL